MYQVVELMHSRIIIQYLNKKTFIIMNSAINSNIKIKTIAGKPKFEPKTQCWHFGKSRNVKMIFHFISIHILYL